MAAGEVPLAPGAAAVAYCVARAYLFPTDLRYVRPLAGRLLGSDAPKTLWMLDGYDELDAAEGMAADLREAALAALTVRKQTAAAAGRQGTQAAVATADDDEPAPPGEAGGAAAAAAGADPSAAEPLNPTAAAAAAAAAAALLDECALARLVAVVAEEVLEVCCGGRHLHSTLVGTRG